MGRRPPPAPLPEPCRWRRTEKEPRARERRVAELTKRIKEIHADSADNYGSPHVHAVLRRQGTRVGRERRTPDA
ncbi:IS3 family transposase [Streptomyces sp. BBFR102]|uniref:IS3 family transposase n=1 Tax=Streptomyces sp. BBFR102 TaxID=3448171 RepID=UPI003F538C55